MYARQCLQPSSALRQGLYSRLCSANFLYTIELFALQRSWIVPCPSKQGLKKWSSTCSYTSMRQRASYRIALVALALSLSAMAQDSTSQDSPAHLDFAVVIQKVEKMQRSARPEVFYQLVREYRLYSGSGEQCTSDVLAEIQYAPPDSASYVIRQRTGSPRGEQVVRRILEHEVVLVTGDPESRSAALLTRDNYDFTDLGQSVLNGQTYYLLGLTPKRKQKQLIVGRAWVDQSSFRVRRIEGQLSKSPSWLLKNVHVKLDFADQSGNSVQSAMEATADVRFIGTQILRAQMLDYRPTNSVAGNIPGRPQPMPRSIPAELIFRNAK